MDELATLREENERLRLEIQLLNDQLNALHIEAANLREDAWKYHNPEREAA